MSKHYKTTFNQAYSEEFPHIIASRKGNNFAFCAACRCDFSLAHAGRNDVFKHSQSKKHMDNVKCIESNKKLSFTCDAGENRVTRAECYFTSFIVEHNLPLSCADHTGQLFRKMFPDSDLAKKYSCARTKTTAILGEMESKTHASTIQTLKRVPFSISTDGSNQGGAKLYPIVVTFHNEGKLEIESRLLSVPALEGDSTGINIGNLLLQNLKENGIPYSNCLALGADNAPVMVGHKSGVASVLKREIPNLVVIGCPCHLVNLAAEKAAAFLPVKVDEMLVDIFYYLEKSEKRKEKVREFQKLHDTDVKKILKHVCTRWLSLGKCLGRLLEQWQPLTSFFMEETKSAQTSERTGFLQTYHIPKLKDAQSSFQSSEPDVGLNVQETGHDVQTNDKPTSSKKRQLEVVVSNVKKLKVKDAKSVNLNEKNTKKPVRKCEKEFLSREERIFMFLSCDLNKTFCLFLQNVIPVFEKTNILLQSAEPHIHVLRSVLLESFRNLISRIVLASTVKTSHVLDVDYHNTNNQKSDMDLVVGSAARRSLEKLNQKQKEVFFPSVRKYYTVACDYMVHKFPVKSDVLVHAEVADINSISTASFSSLRFFVEKFPCMLHRSTEEEPDLDSEIDTLEAQFCSFQVEDITDELSKHTRMDTKWSRVGEMTNADGTLKYDRLSRAMLSILSIPHSNAECERIFSQVKKNRTQFRSSMTDAVLEKLLKLKSAQRGLCYEQEFDSNFLNKAKSATFMSLHK